MPPEPLLIVYGGAYTLDLLVGDPRGMPHPVRGVGWAAARMEGACRRLVRSEAWAGLLFWLAIVGTTLASGLGAMALAALGGPWAERAAAGLLVYFCLAVRDMDAHARAVGRALRAGDLPAARGAVSKIVGRDTAGLDEAGVSRACVESVSESLTDGVVAPLFYAFLGGPVLALVYKAASTLDSMVGHTNERYARFGTASARADDFLNWLPARIALVLLAAAALLAGRSPRRALATGIRDGRKAESPNAGLPQAAVAGALRVRLGGPASHEGERVEKAWFFEEGREAAPADIGRALVLFHLASAAACLGGMALLWQTGWRAT